MPSLRLDGLCRSFGATQAINGLDLEVGDGEYMCLLGPTGAGKTTTLRLVAGLILPDRGSVIVDGVDVTKRQPEERRATMMSQTYALFPHMTVASNIVFGPFIQGWSEKDRVNILHSLLDMVHLTNRKEAYPAELSGGMAQRTALARALGSGADTLLLDEPLRALDARLRIALRMELRSLARSLGKTVIHVTHDQEEAMVMADRIAVIRDGRIIQVGTPKEIFEEPATPFVANFLGQSNFFIGKMDGVEGELQTVIDDAGHRILCRRSDDMDGDVVVAVKVGNTNITVSGTGFLDGKVERILYEGPNLHVDIGMGDLGRMSAKLPNRKMGELSIGDEVSISWDPAKATSFRLPEGGLEKELRVE